MSAPIAIVGMAGTYAGAPSKDQFWSNVLNSVDCVAEAPADWLGPFFDEHSQDNDRIYNRMGGFLREGAGFDPMRYGIMPRAVDGGEPDQFLALKLAREALDDAGYLDADFDRSRAGVVLGRGTYINRGYTNLLQHGLVIDQTLQLLAQARPDLGPAELKALRASLKAQLPPFNTEMAPGLVPNVTSGLIANRLDLMGPNYILDAACASTLIAIDHAVRELQSGRADLMLTGGVQASTPPQIVMIFCQLGAIARGPLRPFSAQAGGTLLGEGAGLFVLKRLEDAQRDEDRVYAVIRGIGSSSDGKAKGLLAPRPEGEVLAIRRGYDNAGVDPASVQLVECHGTGIPLGDATEIGSLREVFGEREGPAPRVAIGSVKSMIAHCLPAAGSAALMKTALALHDKLLPPTLCEEVHPGLELEKTPFYVNTETRPWLHDPRQPRRAGINAFGFGGVNAHLVLEEFRPARERVQVQLPLPVQDRELFVRAAESPAALAEALEALAAAAQAGEFLSLQQPARGEHRASMVAADAADLAKKAQALADKVRTAKAPFSTRSGSAYGSGPAPGKLAFVFPGEGAQYPGMLSGLARRFPVLRAWLDFVEGNADAELPRPRDVLAPPPTAVDAGQQAALEARLYDMDLASESIFASSRGLYALLQQCGLKPDLLLGHSTGEHAALVTGGAFGDLDAEGLAALTARMNRCYQGLLQRGEIARGSLFTVGALDAQARTAVLEAFDPEACVAIDNCPNQAVIYARDAVAEPLRLALIQAGGIVAELPFDRAYHTPDFQPVAAAFRADFAQLPMQAPSIPVISCASTQAFPSDAEAIRDLACEQWAAPVRFRETILGLLEQGVGAFVEVGPSGNLTAFIQDTLKASGSQALAVACNSRRQNDQATFFGLLGQLWCAGYALDLQALQREPLAAAPVADPPLATVLPMLHWPEGFAAPAASKPRPPVPEQAEAPSAVQPSSQLLPPSPGNAVLQQHFALMQDFLAQQKRVLDLMGGTTGPASRAAQPLLDAAPLVSGEVAQARARLHPARHLYLQDHCLGAPPSLAEPERTGLAVLPFTFSIEMLAQTAAALAPEGWVLVEVREARGQRWLALDQGPLELRLRAQRSELSAQACHCQGQIEDGAAGMAFTAELVFAPSYPQAPGAQPVDAAHPISHNPPAELYRRGMFHGPRLQGVSALRGWGSEAIAAELRVLPRAALMAQGSEFGWHIDPILLDALGQLAGYWLSEKYQAGFNCFPYRVGRLCLYAPPPAVGQSLRGVGTFREDSETAFAADWRLCGADGELLLQVQEWCDRRFAVGQAFTDWRSAPRQRQLSRALELPALPVAARCLSPQAGDFWEQGGAVWLRVAAHLISDAKERAAFYALSPARRGDWLRGRIAAKEAVQALARQWGLDIPAADIGIDSDAQGAPQVRCPALPQPVVVSIAHHGGAAVAVAASAELAVGIDLLTQVDDAEAVARVGLSAAEQSRLGSLNAEQRSLAVAKAWTAREAAAKAVGTGLQGRPDQWQLQGDVVCGPQGQMAQVHWISPPEGLVALATAPRHFLNSSKA